MYDILDVIKNLNNLTEHTPAFKVIKDFERVFDELDVYVFKNWLDGELVEGPIINRYTVICKFMWSRSQMPDPKGGERLTKYDCVVKYGKSHILKPRKIKDPDDFRPGTKKGKIDAHPVWIVSVEMPKKLMQDVAVGKDNKMNNKLAELMKYRKIDVDPETAAQETPPNV
jgi:hypothetical protein